MITVPLRERLLKELLKVRDITQDPEFKDKPKILRDDLRRREWCLKQAIACSLTRG